MDSFWNWWNSLTQTAREAIFTGLLVAVAFGILSVVTKGFWKLLGKSVTGLLKLLQRLLTWILSPANTPELKTSESKPELTPAPPQPREAVTTSQSQDVVQRGQVSLIPRPPRVGFVRRYDSDGREIVERLKEELTPGNNRLVTLSGAGGLGKTTLAAEAARQLYAVFDGRVVWSSADGRADFALLSLLDDIATQLERADLRTLAPSEKEEQVRALVCARPTLVVTDNYETIAPEEKQRIEAWFKPAQCSALFTSRPRIEGTVFVPVSAMSRKEAEDFLKRLTTQAQDKKIFSRKVRQRIYDTAEANPYVMQWVFGQIDSAQETDTVLKELQSGEGEAAQRVFDRSFNLLDDDGRDALLALSLFAPSATRAALSAAAGFDDERRVNEALKNLNRLWLVKGIDENRRLAVEGLTRSMAAARLSRDPRADEFRRRFVAYLLSYAVERKAPTPENYDALEMEKDNLLGAAEAAFSSEDWDSVTRMAYTLAGPVEGMLSMRGYWGEAVKLGEQALQAARALQDEARVAGLSHNLAVMYQYRGELAEARRLYGESLEISKKLGDQHRVAITLIQLGRFAEEQVERKEARRLYSESLEISKRLGDQRSLAVALNQLGGLADDEGDKVEARRLYGESLGIEKKLDNLRGVARTLHNLAILAHKEGDKVEARRLYGESFEISKRLGDQDSVAITFHQLGRLAEDEGDKAEAARLFREALNIFERLGSTNAEISRRCLARVEG